jgi:hypothetical protein
MPAMSGPDSIEGDEPEIQFRDFIFGEIHQRFRCLKINRERLQFYFNRCPSPASR